ncbi:hypothetical protein JOY44_19375 [Phormidium sp. CLA17]|uniref:hypothetical protein n=1 Tax=Leptolyngbya sp. Cla-17 TaxID=2803751 RepID=UPI001490F63D|nr:hypothetical protein [Leptolyngbya sp. Cla-17]MBM0743752.1 hypothetical protein [Leptolyngbya sp. Cla-17]
MANVSGSWLGTYWQNANPTRFEVTFVQAGNTISGSILDDSPLLGEAQAAGEVIGRTIQFTKQYLTTSIYPINYSGLIAEDENSMQGSWTIQGLESGNWEAHRSGDDLIAELQNRRLEAIPLGNR